MNFWEIIKSTLVISCQWLDASLNLLGAGSNCLWFAWTIGEACFMIVLGCWANMLVKDKFFLHSIFPLYFHINCEKSILTLSF